MLWNTELHKVLPQKTYSKALLNGFLQWTRHIHLVDKPLKSVPVDNGNQEISLLYRMLHQQSLIHYKA